MKQFSGELLLALECQELENGFKFTNPNIKSVALLKAARFLNRAFLQPAGFYVQQSSFEKGFALLGYQYGREQHIFVKTQAFILVSKDDNANYAAKVEWLSSLLLAINNLRDDNLWIKLMTEDVLDWEELEKLLKTMLVNKQIVEILGNSDRATIIEWDISLVCNYMLSCVAQLL